MLAPIWGFRVTDIGLEKLAAGCLDLDTLSLGGDLSPHHVSVTDAGLEMLAAGCSKLVVVNLADCNQVTPVGLEKLAAGCWNLGRLDIRGCFNEWAGLTAAQIETLTRGRPGLSVERVG